MPTDDTLIGHEYYVFRDSTHNLIFVEDPKLGILFRSILDTYEFQRLRRVRQTGLAALVYPSLEGTRFPHSLGSFAIGKRVVEALREQQPDAKFGFPEALKIDGVAEHGFAIASALHDIGHGPLSHTWEIVDHGLSLLDTNHVPHEHERAGLDLVLSADTEIGALFSRHLAKPDTHEGRVVDAAIRFLRKQHPLAYLRPLLSGNLDIDRLDFIARDTKNAGVTYGSHDVDWLIRSMRFGRLPQRPKTHVENSWVIAIDARKGLNALVQYLRARENMYGLVYLHKTVRAANWHLTSIITYAAHLLRQKLLSNQGIPLLEYLETGKFSGPLGLLQFDDADVWHMLKHLAGRSAENRFLATSAENFLARKLYKSRQVSANTAGAVRKVLEKGGLASRIRGRFSGFPEISDPSKCSDELLCQISAQVDEVPFDVIGKEKGPEDETWIMYRRPTDIGLLPLREYWRRTVDDETSKTYYFVHFIAEIAPDILEIINRLEGVFPLISMNTEPASLPSEVSAPKGFEIHRVLSEDGVHKRAFLSVFVGSEEEKNFSCGEPYVLKQYRDISDERAAYLADRINDIYGIRSPHLSEVFSIRVPKQPLWLVERLWVADLQKLIKETGTRQDLEFLLKMGADLFRGLSQLAKKEIRHGDIKLENAGFIDEGGGQYKFVLGDFGCATAVPDAVPQTEEALGTLKTRPPELLVEPNLRRIGLGSDIWALAATVFAAAMGRYPFMNLEYDRKRRTEAESGLIENLPALRKTLEKDLSEKLPPVLSDILRPCLIPDLRDRPAAIDVAKQFDDAITECRRVPSSAESRISTGRRDLYWKRAIDLVDIDRYGLKMGLNASQNAKECAEFLKDGQRWIPGELHRLLDEIVSRKRMP